MPGALKARDLQRNPRYPIHSNPGDGSMTEPDLKISGRAAEVVAEEFAAYAAERSGLPRGRSTCSASTSTTSCWPG